MTHHEPPVPAERYLSDRFQWAAPGDQQEDAWIVRFCDNDVRDMLFTGPDAEREAWAAWERHAPGYNLYVFRLATLSTPPGRPTREEIARLIEVALGVFPDGMKNPEMTDGISNLAWLTADAICALLRPATSGEGFREGIEAAARVAECAFDDRPNSRSGHHSEMDWTDGYRDGTRAAASAIRALGASA